MNPLTRYITSPPRPRVFTPGDLFGAVCLLLIMAVPLIAFGG